MAKIPPVPSPKKETLPASIFAIPADKAFPIHTRALAQNSLAKSAGTPQQPQVHAAIAQRYPDMVKNKTTANNNRLMGLYNNTSGM